MQCKRCGALIKPNTIRCEYCKTKHNCIFVTKEELNKLRKIPYFVEYNPFIVGVDTSIGYLDGCYVIMKD